ncbi:MAG: hypothetical protein HYV97_15190 [Bdellovibrio sp.]|nr:hypothetical protein [Bdellovibrio sp.]
MKINSCFNFQTFLIILLALSWVFVRSSSASMESEYQEIRLAKAELMMVDKKDKEAFAMVKQNIIGATNFHLPSYLFIADWFYNKKYYASAFRALKMALNKSHGQKISMIVDQKDFEEQLNRLTPLSQQSLEIVFNIAQKYFAIAQKSKGESELKIKLFEFARRYFTICTYFNYLPGYPEYFLGIIETELKDYSSAVNQFLDAKNKLAEQQVQDTELESGLDFYLGSSLINQGKYDAGVLYLKTLFHSEKANEALKSYADMYFKALSNDLYSLSFSSGLQYHENIHLLNNNDRKLMPLIKSEYGKVAGAYRNLGGSAYYYSGMGKKWSSTFIFSGVNLSALDREQKLRDYSSYGSSLLLQANHSEKTIPGITFSYNRSFYRPSKNVSSKSYQTIIEVNPQINYLTKKGISTAKLQLNQTRDSYGDHLYKTGIYLNYVPLFRRKWLAPSFTVESVYFQESEPYKSSFSYSGTLINHMTLGNYGDLFLTLIGLKNTNQDPSYDYVEQNYELLWSIPIPVLKGVILSISVGQYFRRDEVPAKIEDKTAEVKLSWSL